METLFIGKNTLFLSEIESTNSYAMDMLRNVNVHEGTVIYTENQTKGRGQRGAEWIAESGQNLTISMILKPNFLNTNDVFYLSKIAALACYDVLTEFVKHSHNDIKIKWPNDILIKTHKIGGILIENTYLNGKIQYSVIGLGLNINQTNFNHLSNNPTSLKLINQSEQDYDKKMVLEKFCMHFEKWYLRLKEQKSELINNQYFQCLYGIGTDLKFINNQTNERFIALILGVTKEGKLHVRKHDSTEMFFDIKEISFVL